MCFSAEADVVSGLVVGALGIDAIRHARRPADRWLGALPLVLAGHQLVEAVLWWGLDDHVSHAAWRAALYVYLVVAFGILPVLVPVAVGSLEPGARRRRVRVFLALGTAVAVVLVYAVVRGPVSASIDGRHIAYEVDVWGGGLVVALYVVATCGSLLISGQANVRWFGAANVVAVGVLAWTDTNGLISLWCGWAAITSIAIALHLRHAEDQPRSARGAISRAPRAGR